MKKKILFVGFAFVVFILIFIVPIFLDYCILGNAIKSNVENDVWMSFFGSYFGGLFGACATMIVFYLTYTTTERQRKKDERQSIEKEKERIRLSIIPFLYTARRALSKDENLKEERNTFFVKIRNSDVKQMRTIPNNLKNLEPCDIYKKYFVIDSELINNGVGSAVNIKAWLNGKQFLFNESLGVGHKFQIYYILSLTDAYPKRLELKFEFSDVMGDTHYAQEEKAIIQYKGNDELCWEPEQYLTLPQIIK